MMTLSTNPARGQIHHHDDHHHSTTMIGDHHQIENSPHICKRSPLLLARPPTLTRGQSTITAPSTDNKLIFWKEKRRDFKRGAEYKTWEEGDACTWPRLFEIRYLAASLGWEDFSLLALLPSLSSSLLSLSLSLCIVNISYCSLPCVEILPHWRAGCSHHYTHQ